MEPIPQRAPLLFAQLLFPGEAAAVVLVEAGLLFCFPSTWKENKTGLMKNTHGKCFITSSASPTALWHGSVIGRTSPSGRLAPSRAERRPSGAVGGRYSVISCQIVLEEFALISSWPQFPTSTPASPAQHWPYALQYSRVNFKTQGLGVGGRCVETLGTKHNQPVIPESREMDQNHRVIPNLQRRPRSITLLENQ